MFGFVTGSNFLSRKENVNAEVHALDFHKTYPNNHHNQRNHSSDFIRCPNRYRKVKACWLLT